MTTPCPAHGGRTHLVDVPHKGEAGAEAHRAQHEEEAWRRQAGRGAGGKQLSTAAPSSKDTRTWVIAAAAHAVFGRHASAGDTPTATLPSSAERTVADHEHVAKIEGGLHQAVHVRPRVKVVEAVGCGGVGRGRGEGGRGGWRPAQDDRMAAAGGGRLSSAVSPGRPWRQGEHCPSTPMPAPHRR